tara:strand:+ start:2727 stop:2963 length:237 start_codon:yes stop_codon:yes gene_type:complete
MVENIRKNKHERFIKLAESRMKKVLLALASLRNLSNKQNYEYSKEEASQMLNFLKNEIRELENSFLKDSKKKDFKFNK